MDVALSVTVALIAGGLGGAVVYAVVWALLGRKGGADPDVDELITTVANISRNVRRLEMQRVRASAPVPAQPGEFPTATGAAASGLPLESKEQLRARVFGRQPAAMPMPPGGKVA